MVRLYYDSRTGNVKRLVDKIKEKLPDTEVMHVSETYRALKPGHLITYTTGLGSIPKTTQKFLEENSEWVLTVSSSGNRNWGRTFAMAGKKISEQWGIPLAHTFELSGMPDDVDKFVEILSS